MEPLVSEMVIPASGDFGAWAKRHPACVAVDWDGTCMDTMVPKWTRGFNLAITEVWPALAPHQKEVDDICWKVNLVEHTAGVQRFVALMHMMRRWRSMGLPAPDLEKFFRAVEHVEASGEQHGVATYRKYQSQFGYDDSPFAWSEASDRHIAEAVKTARLFDHCRATLEALVKRADIIVVSASKTEAVRQDVVREKMTHLFAALCAQDFLPKKGILAGLAERYERVLFLGDTQHDVEAGEATGVPVYLVRTGDEAASWAAALPVIEQYLSGRDDVAGLIHPGGKH
jgi:phosphoglycolate phosphatase-like HAD superfamily hydrolase